MPVTLSADSAAAISRPFCFFRILLRVCFEGFSRTIRGRVTSVSRKAPTGGPQGLRWLMSGPPSGRTQRWLLGAVPRPSTTPDVGRSGRQGKRPSRHLVGPVLAPPQIAWSGPVSLPPVTAPPSHRDAQQPVQREGLSRLLDGRRQIRQGVPRDGLILHHLVEIPVDPIDAGSQGTGLQCPL